MISAPGEIRELLAWAPPLGVISVCFEIRRQPGRRLRGPRPDRSVATPVHAEAADALAEVGAIAALLRY